MAKYRKKPVVIEAVQLRWDTWDEICEFADVGTLEDGKSTGTTTDLDGNPFSDDGPGLLILTLGGPILAYPGDWIIKGVEGELYPCKPDIFDKIHDLVEGELGGVLRT